MDQQKKENELVKQVAVLGFVPDRDYTPTTTCFRFHREDSPLEVMVDKHPQGCYVIVNSKPFRYEYHRHTNFIGEEEIVNQIKQYLNELGYIG
ncbi:MAG: hypothetical protein ABIA37_00400 [Candidatus Woesearchaeota archaeon]